MATLDTLLIHIGYPKTATTWLQSQVFEGLPDLFSAPWPTSGNRIIEEVCWTNPHAFDADATRAAFIKDAAPLMASGRIPVISHEGLVGDATQRLLWGFEAANRLYASFPKAKIIISIREQGALATSLWQEYVVRGGVLSLEQFLFNEQAQRPGYRPHCSPDWFTFADLVAHYQSLFGKEQVLVLPMEWLKQRPDHYADTFFTFAGATAPEKLSTAPVYPARSASYLSVARGMNRMRTLHALDQGARRRWQRWSRRLSRLVPEKLADARRRPRIEAARARVRQSTAQDNQRLAELTGIDLQSLGYSMPEDHQNA